MNIKGKLITILILIGLILGGHTSIIIWNSFVNVRQIRISDADFDDLIASAKTRSSIDRQMKEATDYLRFRKEKDKKQFEQYGMEAKIGLGEWIQAIQLIIELGKEEEENHLKNARNVENNYHESLKLITKAFDLADEGKNKDALKLIEGVQSRIDHLFGIIDHAMDEEIKELKDSHDKLLVGLGLTPWVGEKGVSQVEMAQAPIQYFLALDRIRSNINRQMKKMFDYLISGQEQERKLFETYGMEVHRGLKEWTKTIHLQMELGALEKKGNLEKVREIEKQYEKALKLISSAFAMSQNGNPQKVFHQVETKVEPFVDGLLLPKIVEAIENSKKEMHEAHQKLLDFTFYTTVQTVVLLIIVSVFIVFLSINLIRGIIISLSKLRKGIEIIGKGKLDYRIELKSKDELGQLASSFDQMTEQLQEIIKRKQEQERIALSRERLVRIGEISTGVAHTIRNPLHGIVNCTEILQKRLPDDDTTAQNICVLMMKGLKRIERVTRRLLTLTHDSPLQIVTTDINLLVQDALKFVETKAQKRKIRLSTKFSDEIPTLPLDPDRLSEALINLLSNALDACQQGDKVFVETKRDSGNGVCIRIEDTGEGIPIEFFSKVLDPFFTTKPVGKGTGLGLPITRRIVEEHGGELTLDSVINQGTKIQIFIPFDPKKKGKEQIL